MERGARVVKGETEHIALAIARNTLQLSNRVSQSVSQLNAKQKPTPWLGPTLMRGAAYVADAPRRMADKTVVKEGIIK